MTYEATFHPGATAPILTCYTHPHAGVIGDWTATYQLRKRDADDEATLELAGVITEVAAADLVAAITREFPGLDTLWQIIVTPDRSDTQDLRGVYRFGCDLDSDDENDPLFDDALVNFGTDIARAAV